MTILWLLLAGAALVAVSSFQTIVPVAAWLAPVLLLRAARDARSDLAAGAGVALAFAAGTLVALRDGVIPLPLAAAVGITLFAGVLHALPYLLDRRLGRHLDGVPRALVFPLGMTAIEYLGSRPSPFGSWGVTAYSQTGNLPLLQLVALTGVWGVAFVIHALAPAANAAWEARRAPTARALAPAGAFVALLAAVLLGGGARLAALGGAPAGASLAAVASSDAAYEAAFDVPRPRELAVAPAATREEVAARLERLWPEQLARTVAAAEAGARLVAWPESMPLMEEHLDHWLAETSRVAREHHVAIVVTPWLVRRTDDFPWAENLAVLVDETGRVRWRFAKGHPVLGIEDRYLAPGDVDLPVAETAVGTITAAICHDLDFPWWTRRAGRTGAGIFVTPSDDWPAITATHLQIAIVRAVENGVTLVRPTHNGTSAIIDPLGRVRAVGTTTRDAGVTILAPASTAPLPVVYPWVGDAFAGLAIAALAALAVAARRRAASPGPVAAPEPVLQNVA